MGDIILPPVIRKEDVRSAVWDSLEVTPPTGSYGERLITNLDAKVTSRATPGDILVDPTTKIDAAKLDIAVSTRMVERDVFQDIRPTTPTTGSYDEFLRGRLDVAVSTRASPSQVRAEVDGEFTERGATAARFAKLDRLDVTVSSRSSHSATDVWAVATRELTKYEVSYILAAWLGRWEATPYVENSRVSTTLAAMDFYMPGEYHSWAIPRDALGLTKLILLTNAILYVAPGGGESTLKARTTVGEVTLYSLTTAGASATLILQNDITTILGETRFWYRAELAGDGTNASWARVYAAMLIGVKE